MKRHVKSNRNDPAKPSSTTIRPFFDRSRNPSQVNLFGKNQCFSGAIVSGRVCVLEYGDKIAWNQKNFYRINFLYKRVKENYPTDGLYKMHPAK